MSRQRRPLDLRKVTEKERKQERSRGREEGANRIRKSIGKLDLGYTRVTKLDGPSLNPRYPRQCHSQKYLGQFSHEVPSPG